MARILDANCQIFMQEAGQSGCYAICLVEVASEFLGYNLPLYESLKIGTDKKDIYYNDKNANDPDNFFVQYPETFLFHLTGRHWRVTKENSDYRLQKNEWKINRWERKATGATYGHFDMENFHPISNSLTCKLGKIVSTRICKVLN